MNDNSLILYLSIIIQIFVLFIGTYYFIISIFGWLPKREKSSENISNKQNTFALVVAAHNEEAVIGNMVESLKNLNYPKEYYDIFVIADNCTDRTAEIARQYGAIVYERFDDKARGKGFALEWMFNNIFNMDKEYDAIAVFDADNIVSNNFLTEMNKQLNKGYKVVQGYIDSKNPFDSWITCAYTISFWTINRLFQKARYNLGLCCQLSGTGFVVKTEILKKLGWGATCLTEDMEFTMKLALNNEKVAWAHNAVVYDEKPLTLSQSWKQRKRWMQGHADVASRFCSKLITKAIKERDIIAFDCCIYLLQPLRVIASGCITLMAWLQTCYPEGKLPFFQLWYLFEGHPEIWYFFLIVQFLYIPFVLVAERKFNYKVFIGYLLYFFYSLTWVPITIQGILNKNNKEWFHTQHTRQISIKELEKVA